MAIDRFVRIGKVAMATIGTVWTVSNVEVVYKQTKLFLVPSSYTFLFFHLILLSILFQYSSSASTLNHLLRNLHQTIMASSTRNPAPHQSQILLENQLSRSFSEIWHRIMGPESEKGDKEDFNTVLEQTPPLNEDQFAYLNEDEKEEGEDIIILGEEDGGKDSMEDTWKAIMEGKKEAEERELKKSNTWGVTPTIEQMKGNRPFGVEPSKSLRVEGENEAKDCLETGHWGWRRMETVLSRDELNFRAEEFIKRIKNNIRLERLQSYNLFLQLINRRAN